MKNLRSIICASMVCYCLSAQAQETPSVSATDTLSGKKNAADTTKSKTIWTFGISGIAIDDDGNPGTDLFSADNWHFVPYPSQLHIDAAFNPKWSIEGALSFTQYQAGKMVNDVIINEDHQFVAFDLNAKYHFAGQSKVLDPYGLAGLGFTYRSLLQEQTPTLNAGLGINIWLMPTFGLNLQSQVKFKLNSKSSSYLMHSLGLNLRFGE